MRNHSLFDSFFYIVWSDTRTKDLVDGFKASCDADTIANVREISGLQIHTYFSALKIRWLLDNVAVAKEEVESGRAIVGTMDSWIIWNLTGIVTPLRTVFVKNGNIVLFNHDYLKIVSITLFFCFCFLCLLFFYAAVSSSFSFS
jgi:glycerol kinase